LENLHVGYLAVYEAKESKGGNVSDVFVKGRKEQRKKGMEHRPICRRKKEEMKDVGTVASSHAEEEKWG